MKKIILGLFVVLLAAAPSLSFARGVPLFFQTGDELFEIEGAPTLDEGYSIGYACKRFGLFGADAWTWDCNLMAVNLEKFSAGNLGDQVKTEMSAKYSLSDRKRNPWNHYGIAGLVVLLIGAAVVKKQKTEN